MKKEDNFKSYTKKNEFKKLFDNIAQRKLNELLITLNDYRKLYISND